MRQYLAAVFQRKDGSIWYLGTVILLRRKEKSVGPKMAAATKGKYCHQRIPVHTRARKCKERIRYAAFVGSTKTRDPLL